jgi:hypothetical protein
MLIMCNCNANYIADTVCKILISQIWRKQNIYVMVKHEAWSASWNEFLHHLFIVKKGVRECVSLYFSECSPFQQNMLFSRINKVDMLFALVYAFWARRLVDPVQLPIFEISVSVCTSMKRAITRHTYRIQGVQEESTLAVGYPCSLIKLYCLQSYHEFF